MSNHPARRWQRAVVARLGHAYPSPSRSLAYNLTQGAKICIFEWRPADDHLLIIGDMASRLGYAAGQFPRTMAGFISLVLARDQAGLKAELERACSDRRPLEMTLEIQTQDGESTYWRIRGAGVWNRQNNFTCVIGLLRDATEMMRDQKRLLAINEFLESRMRERNAQLEEAVGRLEEEVEQRQQAEMRYRTISELISDFAFIAYALPDGKFDIDWASDSAQRILGDRPKTPVNPDDWLGMISPLDHAAALRDLERIVQGETVANELRFIRQDGAIIYISLRMKPILDPETGQISMIFGAGQDVTERKRVEIDLFESQARFYTLFNHSPVALWEEDHSAVKAALDVLREQGVTDFGAYFTARPDEALALFRLVKILNYNWAALGLYEKENTDNLASDLYDIVVSDLDAWIQELVLIASGEKEFELERASVIKPGHVQYSELHFSTVPGYEKSYGRTLISILDVTARRRVEQSLRYDAQRLRLLNSITTQSLALGDFKTTLRTVAERMRAFAGAEDCFITRWDAEKQAPIMLAGTGDVEERVIGHSIPPGEPNITRTVLEADRVLLIGPQDTNLFNQHTAYLFGNGPALAMPLKVGEEKIGAAVLVFKRPPQLTDEDMDLWGQVAAQVSLAIASLQLFDQSRQRTYELEKLVQVSSEMRQAPSFEEIVRILLREIALIMDADSSALLIQRGNKWMAATNKGMHMVTRMGGRELSEEMIEELEARVNRYESDFAALGNRTRVIPWLKGMVSFTFAAVRTSESTVGLVGVGWRTYKEVTSSHRRLLTAVAEIAGSALQRSNLLETLEQRVQDRTRDLQILYDLSALANRPQGVMKVAKSALKQMVKVLGGKGGFLYQPKDGEPVMQVTYTFGIPAEVRKAVERIPLGTDRLSRFQNALEPVYVPDAHISEEVPPEFFSHGFNAAIWAPIWAEQRLWGFMAIMGDVSDLNPEEKNLFKAVVGLVATVAENAALQKKAKDVAVMEERQRLARALHDSVSQSLYSLSLFSEAGREHAQTGNAERTLHYLERSSETAKQALREMRMLLYELRPPELEKLGLAGALRYRLEAVEQRVGLAAHFEAGQLPSLPAEIEEALFWIAQEALNNTLRHANATRVDVSLRASGRGLVMLIADDGVGFDPQRQVGGGMGLVGMRERAERIKASLRIDSVPGQGTRVRVDLRISGLKKEK